MPKYASGDNIPVVGIQPSAAPVAINVLPAAGQPTKGSQLQQIAESLAPFNQGLMAFGSSMVKQDAEHAQQMGENLDFGGVSGGLDKIAPELRGAELNKRFKSIIETSGGSDASNPYFQIAAQQNYGRTLGLDYRNAIYGMKEQLTDPEHPMTYGDASAKAAESVLGDSLKDNFYAFSGFRDVASKTDHEMQMRFQEERTQRMETLGGMRVQEVMSKAISAEDPILLNASWAQYQLSVTDPAKVRATYITAARSSLQAAPDAESLVKSFEMLAGMQYGNAAVHDNIPLYVDLVQSRDAAETAMMTKLQRETIMGNMAEKKASEQMSGEGMETDVLNHAQSDHFTTESISDYAKKHVDEMAKKFGWSEATKDKMFGNVNDMANKALTNVLQSQGVHDALNDKTIEDKLGKKIMAGEATAEEIMASGASTAGQISMMKLRSEFTNSTVTAKESALESAQNMTASVMSQVVSSVYPGTTPDSTSIYGKVAANEMAMVMKNQLSMEADAFIKGDMRDSSGKTYADYKAISPTTGAASVKGFLDQRTQELLKQRMDQTQIDIKAGRIWENGKWVAKESDAKVSAKYTQANDQVAQEALNAQGGGSVDKAAANVMQNKYSELQAISKNTDMGYFGNSVNVGAVRSRLGQLYYRSKENLVKEGTDRIITNDDFVSNTIQNFLGLGMSAYGGGGDGGVTGTKMNLSEISQDYGTVTRLQGLTFHEILADEDSNGIPVSGVSLPLSKEDKQRAAFNTLMIRSTDELRDSASVSAVLSKLGLSDAEKPRFIQVQNALLVLHKRADEMYGSTWTFTPDNTTPADVAEAKGIMQRTIEQHQARQNTKP